MGLSFFIGVEGATAGEERGQKNWPTAQDAKHADKIQADPVQGRHGVQGKAKEGPDKIIKKMKNEGRLRTISPFKETTNKSVCCRNNVYPSVW